MIVRRSIFTCLSILGKPQAMCSKCNNEFLRNFSDKISMNQEDTSTKKVAHKLNPFANVKSPEQSYLEDLYPPMKKSFNLAAYVNQSETLRELLKLGVSFYDIEQTNYKAAQYFLTLDFERDCADHVKFLVDNGLKVKNLGRFISEFPFIFKTDLDDLQTRLNYLESKGFSKVQVIEILNRSSIILSSTTKTTDYKLGQLQIELNLPAKVLRDIVTSHPNVIAIPANQFKLINFTLTEEFGFQQHEQYEILKNQPKIIEMPRPILVERLDLIHNTMGLKHSMIAKFPKLITGPIMDIKHRYLYLKKLKRNQFNPQEPLYVHPSALYNKSDEEFCLRYAKTSLDDYRLFIKSC